MKQDIDNNENCKPSEPYKRKPQKRKPATSSYAMKFRDSRWQKKRLEIMERDDWTCVDCGASGEGVTLNVHHSYYEKGKAPWEYPNDTLLCLCEGCHVYRHGLQHSINWKLGQIHGHSHLVDIDLAFTLIASGAYRRANSDTVREGGES